VPFAWVGKQKESLGLSTPRATAYFFGIWGCTVLLLFKNNNNKPPLTKKKFLPLPADTKNRVLQ